MTRLNRSAGGMRRHAWVAATLVLLGCGGGGDDGNGSGTQPPTGGTTPPAGAWGCDQDSGWCWAGALARGYPLRDVWVAPSGQAWAVGDAGLVFHFDGSAWRYDTTIADADGVSHLLLAISGTSEQDLWAIDRDRVYHFDGKGWTQVLANGDIVDFDYIADIHAVSPDSVVTVGGSGALLRWDGASWTADEVPAMFDLHTVWGSNPQDYWAGGTDGFESAVLRFDGSTWSEVDTTHLGDSGTQHIVEDVTAMWGAEGGHLWAGGPGGVYHFDGSIWEQSFDAGAVVGGWASGPDGVWAVVEDAFSNGVIRFDGSSWTTEQPLDTEAVTALGGGPDGVVHSIGAQGGIARSDGAGWEIEALAFQDELRGAWVADGGTVWTAAASGGGLMARSSDGWSWRKRDATTDFRSVFGFADDRIWLAGQVAGSPATALWDGAGWDVFQPGGTDTFWNLHGTDAEHVWAVGGHSGEGTVAQLDGSWSTTLTPEGVNGVWAFAPDDVWAVGNEAIVMHFDGSGWATLHEPDPSVGELDSVWGSGPNDVWAVGGSIQHWDGVAWSSLGWVQFPICA